MATVKIFFNLSFVILVIGLVLHTYGVEEEDRKMSRDLSTVLNPKGIWKSASKVLKKGIHSFRESLHEGVKVAQLLKEDLNEGVASFLNKSNSTNKKEVSKARQDVEEAREGMLGGVLRFMGFDSSSIGIVVLNVLIFFAEMITSSMLNKDSNGITDARTIKANILDYIANGHNDKVENFIQTARSEKLPQSLIETLKEKTGNKTACVQLLLCKMTPLVWSVQKTVDKQLNSNVNVGTDSSEQRNSDGQSVWDQLQGSLPNKHGFIAFGDECEKKYPNCKLLKFSNTAFKSYGAKQRN